MTRPIIHIVLHLVVPLVTARLVFKNRFWSASLIMLLVNVVDFDHLLAYPVYDPNRCSIGFHPLHSYIAIGAYAVLAATPKLRIAGIGLLLHMALDYLDCIWMGSG